MVRGNGAVGQGEKRVPVQQAQRNERFGYKFDGWHSDGTFHYTGDGQVGDQSETDGGNRALLAAEGLGRAVILFRSEGAATTYIGEFTLASPPHYRADAPDRNDEMRSVLVFRLVPRGPVDHSEKDDAPADPVGPEELPLEASNVDAYAMARPEEPAQTIRREADLVARYDAWLRQQGRDTVRHRIPLPEGGYMYTDVFDKSTDELIEAKASSARVYIRTGLGQVLDYGRYLPHRSKALLVETRPTDDLIELLASNDVGVIWASASGFERC